MNSSIDEFLTFLESEPDLDYGDFKREVDLHLLQLVDSLRPLSSEQVWKLQRLREELLWMYHDDVEDMRKYLKEEVCRLEVNP